MIRINKHKKQVVIINTLERFLGLVSRWVLFVAVFYFFYGTALAGQKWRESVSTAAVHYSHYAKGQLAPYFKRAGLPYPPQQITLLVFKNPRQMQLWAKHKGSWHYVRSFRVLGASGKSGPKLREGDRQVPEGIYRITEFNPHSHFNLSLMLNYPNGLDRYHAYLDGRRHLGENIFIHGSNRSIGCIAIGDGAIQQLFVLSYLVGLNNIKVIIAPFDLRFFPPRYTHRHPRWLPQLYADLRAALIPYQKM